MKKTKLLLFRFQNQLLQTEVEFFRGAIINSLKEKNILFHNHLEGDGGYRYTYPLIQYKRINQKAAILCFDSGTEAIGDFFFDSHLELNIKGKMEQLSLDKIKADNFLIQIWNTMFHYRIRKWLALNQENHKQYIQLESIAEKSSFLEKILKGNILSFAKGLNIFFEKQVECKITWLGEPVATRYKNIKMAMFDIEFICNVSIPDYTGLGKGVSIGYGIVTRKKEERK